MRRRGGLAIGLSGSTHDASDPTRLCVRYRPEDTPKDQHYLVPKGDGYFIARNFPILGEGGKV